MNIRITAMVTMSSCISEMGIYWLFLVVSPFKVVLLTLLLKSGLIPHTVLRKVYLEAVNDSQGG